jgi:hypothetical protein
LLFFTAVEFSGFSDSHKIKIAVEANASTAILILFILKIGQKAA